MADEIKAITNDEDEKEPVLSRLDKLTVKAWLHDNVFHKKTLCKYCTSSDLNKQFFKITKIKVSDRQFAELMKEYGYTYGKGKQLEECFGISDNSPAVREHRMSIRYVAAQSTSFYKVLKNRSLSYGHKGMLATILNYYSDDYYSHNRTFCGYDLRSYSNDSEDVTLHYLSALEDFGYIERV